MQHLYLSSGLPASRCPLVFGVFIFPCIKCFLNLYASPFNLVSFFFMWCMLVAANSSFSCNWSWDLGHCAFVLQPCSEFLQLWLQRIAVAVLLSKTQNHAQDWNQVPPRWSHKPNLIKSPKPRHYPNCTQAQQKPQAPPRNSHQVPQKPPTPHHQPNQNLRIPAPHVPPTTTSLKLWQCRLNHLRAHIGSICTGL